MSLLVISRQKNEKVKVVVPPSDKETVIYLEPTRMNHRTARIAFDADDSVLILRNELLNTEEKDR